MPTGTDTTGGDVLYLAQRTRLAAQTTLVGDPDGTLDDGIRLLITAARADVATLSDVPDGPDGERSKYAYIHALGRLQNVCEVLAVALARFTPEVRSATPAALNALAAYVAAPCLNDGCAVDVSPWDDDHSGCCSADCLVSWLRATGEAS